MASGGGGGGGALGCGQNLTVDRQFRYVVQWFTEWSDFQRDDFVPILASYLSKGSSPSGPVYVNGIISGMANVSGQDKPMSLFQCRVKLFNEWSSKWPEANRDKLLERLTEIDPEFAKQVERELSGVPPPQVDEEEPALLYNSSIEAAVPSELITTTSTVSSLVDPNPEPAGILLVIGED